MRQKLALMLLGACLACALGACTGTSAQSAESGGADGVQSTSAFSYSETSSASEAPSASEEPSVSEVSSVSEPAIPVDLNTLSALAIDQADMGDRLLRVVFTPKQQAEALAILQADKWEAPYGTPPDVGYYAYGQLITEDGATVEVTGSWEPDKSLVWLRVDGKLYQYFAPESVAKEMNAFAKRIFEKE